MSLEYLSCQPPCEAVSWNKCVTCVFYFSFVSLLVRLWVEITFWKKHLEAGTSASLWGCELKYDKRLNVERGDTVSLLVRLWVEIFRHIITSTFPSVSLLVRLWVEIIAFLTSAFLLPVSLLVRLWVEMRNLARSPELRSRQPPCEAVSWNVSFICCTTSWRVSLLVRLWVEILSHLTIRHRPLCQPPCEAVSWNTRSIYLLTCRAVVSLLVRLWVEIASSWPSL